MSKHSHVGTLAVHTVIQYSSWCASVEMASSAKRAPAISTVQLSLLCIVCGQAIVLQLNRFRCNEPSKNKLTKLGDILEDVAKKADIQFKIAEIKVSHVCRRCRELILRIDKLYQNVLSLQSKLRVQLKQRPVQDIPLSPDRKQHYPASAEQITPMRASENRVQLKQRPVQDIPLSPNREQHYPASAEQITPTRASNNKRGRSITPSREDRPTIKRPMRPLLPKPTKRLLSSPQTRTGLSPAAKCPTTSQADSLVGTHKTPLLPSSVSNVINLPQATTGVCPKKLPFQQEEITIKVYENIEDDKEDNVKVYNHFGVEGCGVGGGGSTVGVSSHITGIIYFIFRWYW